MINKAVTEGLTPDQIRTMRVRRQFIVLKVLTDFLSTGGAALSAALVAAGSGPLPKWAILICIIGAVVAASKNLGDAINSALPPPVFDNRPQSQAVIPPLERS